MITISRSRPSSVVFQRTVLEWKNQLSASGGALSMVDGVFAVPRSKPVPLGVISPQVIATELGKLRSGSSDAE